MLGFLGMALVTVLFLLLLALASSAATSSHSRRRSTTAGAPGGAAPPAGNTGWPVIGETLAFLKPHPSTSIGDFLLQRVSRFGNVFTSNLFGQPTVVSTDAQLNRSILLNESKAFVPGWPRSLIRVLGRHTPLYAVGDDHKYMRSIYVNFLSVVRLQTVFLQGMETAATTTLGSWKVKGVVSAMQEAKKYTFGVIAKAILSLEPNNTETEKLQREFGIFSQGMMSLPLIFPGTAYWNSLKEEHHAIAERKEFKEKPGLGWEDYKQLEFTYCVFNETLRLGNVAMYVQRKTVKDFQYKEHVIPQGFSVMATFSTVHMDPSLFEDPEQFNPWRWKGGPSGIKKSNNFMAFGGGSRLCPGAELAKLEFVVFFHHLIMNYRWELVEPDPPINTPQVDFAKGLHIKIHALEN